MSREQGDSLHGEPGLREQPEREVHQPLPGGGRAHQGEQDCQGGNTSMFSAKYFNVFSRRDTSSV